MASSESIPYFASLAHTVFAFSLVSLFQPNSFCLPSFFFNPSHLLGQRTDLEWEFSCWQRATDYMGCCLSSLDLCHILTQIYFPFLHKLLPRVPVFFFFFLLCRKNLKTLVMSFLMNVYLNTAKVILRLLPSMKPSLLPSSLKTLNTCNISLSFRYIKRTFTLTAVLHE